MCQPGVWRSEGLLRGGLLGKQHHRAQAEEGAVSSCGGTTDGQDVWAPWSRWSLRAPGEEVCGGPPGKVLEQGAEAVEGGGGRRVGQENRRDQERLQP